MDETGWHLQGALAWLWAMGHTAVAWFTGQASRSQAVCEALVAFWAEILGSEGRRCTK